jgi:hypothetical protein
LLARGEIHKVPVGLGYADKVGDAGQTGGWIADKIT